MKLSDVKNKIDRYFDKIDAHKLYSISISEYGFTEYASYRLGFERINVNYVNKRNCDFSNTLDVNETEDLLLAA